jgi:hypothetical protein
MGRGSRLALIGIAIGSFAPYYAGAQGEAGRQFRPDTIRGAVKKTTGEPIAGASVVLTRGPDMFVRTTVTDSLGRFDFANPGGMGEYLLSVSATGLQPARRRIVGDPDQTSIDVKFTLSEWSTTLGTVQILAKRPPEPPSGLTIGPGASERLSEGALATAPPVVDRLRDLVRESLNGTATPDGWSVAGLPAAETQTQLNGLLFRGASLPRNIPRRLRLSASSYDIANAGFSGGLVSIELPRAGEFRTLDLDAVTAVHPGGSETGLAIGSGSGYFPELAIDMGGSWTDANQKRGVTAGVRLGYQQAQQITLDRVSDQTLSELGADPLFARAAEKLISSRSALIASQRNGAGNGQFHFSTLARVDPNTRTESTNAFILGLDISKDPFSPSTPLAASTLGGSRTALEGITQWNRSWVSGSRVLWDWRNGISVSHDVLEPLVPGIATVVVDTKEVAGDSVSGAPVLLGGAPGREESNRLVLEGNLQSDILVGPQTTHQLRFLAAARFDAMQRERSATNATLGFASQTDLKASTPSWSETTAGPGRGKVDVVRVSAGVGDEWRAHPRLRLQYGLRLDAQNLLRPIGTLLEQSQTRNGWGETLVSLSPRLGLTWNVQEPKEGEGYRTSNLFQRHLLPTGVLRFGVGVFQRDFEPDVVLGRPAAWGTLKTRWCPAHTLPIQGWSAEELAPESIDRACATASVAPNGAEQSSREVLSNSFAPPSSLRTTASFLTAWHGVDIELGMLWNEARHEPGLQDIALSHLPLTFLTGEGARPFFSPVTAIDTATGIVRPDLASPDAGVRSDKLVTSDRKSRSTQFTVQVSPQFSETSNSLRLGYSWNRSRELEGGWDRDTFGDPFKLEWGPGAFDIRHQLQFEAGREIGVVSASLWVRGSSGVPFSPLVAGDVNGDGVSGNDRAFIPLLLGGADTSLSDAIASLVRLAPRRIRNCLLRQSGMPAGRNSCNGPWSFTSSFVATVDTRELGFRRGMVVTLAVENLAALADRMLNGQKPHGWGSTGVPDPILFRTTGFSPSRGGFDYVVNPQFGQVPAGVSAQNTGYRISLSLSFSLAPPVQQQQVQRWLRARGVGERLPPDTLARRFARNVSPLYDEVLAEADDLSLEPEQLAWIAAARPAYESSLTAIWSKLAGDLDRLPEKFDVDSAGRLVDAATAEAWELSRLEAHRLRAVLTPIQMRLLPWPASALVLADKPVRFHVIYY